MLASANRVLPLVELAIVTRVWSAVLIFSTRSARLRASAADSSVLPVVAVARWLMTPSPC
jgi:hypothetical protein